MITIDYITEAEAFLKEDELVIFDLDDTLYSEKQYVRSGFRQIENHFQISGLADQLWKSFQDGQKAITVVFKQLGISERETEALEVYRNQQPDITPYPGVREMLARIHQNHYTGMITDGTPCRQREKIKALDIVRYFDQILVTDELGGSEYRKPDPRSFEWMLNKFSIKQAVYIGDNMQKDFIAPERLGMRCIYFHNKDGLYVK